jgi:hypothetical protein
MQPQQQLPMRFPRLPRLYADNSSRSSRCRSGIQPSRLLRPVRITINNREERGPTRLYKMPMVTHMVNHRGLEMRSPLSVRFVVHIQHLSVFIIAVVFRRGAR